MIKRDTDTDTPDSAKSRTGFDGEQYELVFSDEFNTDHRTFYPGDDPFWEAVDLHYWGVSLLFCDTERVADLRSQTNNLEWYDPEAVGRPWIGFDGHRRS